MRYWKWMVALTMTLLSVAPAWADNVGEVNMTDESENSKASSCKEGCYGQASISSSTSITSPGQSSTGINQ